MKLFIPACGDRVTLTKSWAFDLYLERRNPPKIGSVVTYRYTELTDGGTGVPKCASFVSVRDYE